MTDQPPRALGQSERRPCAHCGAWFLWAPLFGWQRFCSVRCGYQAARDEGE